MTTSSSDLLKTAVKAIFSIFMLAIGSVVTIANASVISLDFTSAEKTYIKKNSAVIMCVDPDWAPFERINQQGKHEGIAADLVQLVAQRVGLRIELYPVKDWSESLSASKDGRCQIMSFLNQTPERDTWLTFTDPIFYDPNVIVTREEHGFVTDIRNLQGERIALPKGTMVEERVRRDFPNLSIILTSSEPESMRLVSERKADLTIRSLIMAAYTIKKEGLFNLKIAGQVPEYTNQLRIGVLKDKTVLWSILNKGVKSITPQERDAISNKYVSIAVQEVDWFRIYALLALLAIVAFIALYIFRTNRKLRHALAISQEAHTALHISEERYRLLADNASDVIWTMDFSGRFTYVSPSVERLRGYSVAEVMQQTLEQALTLESAHIAKTILESTIQSIQDKQPVANLRVELEQPCKQGGTVWTEATVAPIQNSKGEFVSLLGVTRDISERKCAEIDLRIAATAFESQDGMMVTDADRVILRVNSAFTKITGYAAEEVIGNTPDFMRSDRHDGDFFKTMWEAIQHRGAWHGEIWNQRKNGDLYPAQLTISAVKERSGQVTHYVATMHDITKRKQLEEDVQQLAFYDPLTHLPNRRLLQDRLSQALTRAKRTQTRIALLFIDLDKFKPINDQHGHEVGDWVLQTVARRIERCIRASDTVARIGGDEFLVLLSDLQNNDDSLTVAEKIRTELDQPFITPSLLALHASSSIGIAIYPDHGDTEQDLLRFGDRAMYQVKNEGGNAVALFALNNHQQDADGTDSSAHSIVRLTWKPAFACGQETIDKEHQELFRLSNTLLDKVAAQSRDPNQIEAEFDTLLTHIVEHFAHEEAILLAHGYEHLQGHIRIHQTLEAKARKLRQSIDCEEEVSLGALVDFLVIEVVGKHMLNEDRFSQLFSALRRNQ
jgi:diguanylate cyclase (GGDEF)-like protein/PAS domain S-box-containing protein/hemerythrin-like metal-binding protein